MNRFFYLAGLFLIPFLVSADPAPPAITNSSVNGSAKAVKFAPYPAAKIYSILSSSNLTSFTTNAGVVSGFSWAITNNDPIGFFQLQVTPLSSNELLTATVLNRLAYGPTPDDLERILTGPSPIGAQAYIDEQLAPQTISETVSNAHPNINLIQAKFPEATDFVTTNHAAIQDLRAWHCLLGIGAKRQLLEILLQFLENHFVTQYDKSVTYFDTFYDDFAQMGRLATQLEYLENEKWRNALLNPSCTFYDLLKISAESPAMIIYLDTVNSKGNANNIANENYAREILELFTFGVDNGYDQNDITVQSRCWTGWSVEMVDAANAFNPFALRTINNIPGVTSNFTQISNLFGVFAFNFKNANHNTSAKTIFPGKTVPARFGAPWSGNSYQLTVPARTGTNGIQDGYDVITHLANQPFTEEFISVKLCRLFVHDDFALGYNFTDPNLSPEGQLVKQCMLTWENSSPKGQIWPVLATIFNSDLFRGHNASMQKVKTPLEFVLSAIRAVRASTNGTFSAGTFTADTDGYAISGTSSTAITPLTRMGAMSLFNRAEPNGYPESAPGWISAGTLAERVRFVQSFCILLGQAGHGGSINDAGNSTCDPVKLLKNKLPSASWNDAGAVADYFLSVIYPGEGKANLDLFRTAAMNYLNTDDTNIPPQTSLFSGVLNTSTIYDTRVRGMVGLLLTFQRFQEQ
ncbi:MAG: DUF1800 family protein [Limisphaerales bacterium]